MVNGQRFLRNADTTLAEDAFSGFVRQRRRFDFLRAFPIALLPFRLVFANQIKESAFPFCGTGSAFEIMAKKHQGKRLTAKFADAFRVRLINMPFLHKLFASRNKTFQNGIPDCADHAMRRVADILHEA